MSDIAQTREQATDSSVTVPRWRKITFYVVASLVLAMILGLLWPFLLFVVLAWLPLESWQAVFPGEDIDATLLAHRIHELSFGLIFWGLAIGVGLQLRRPAKRLAPMLQAAAVIGAFVVIDLLSGSFDVEALPIMVGVALLVFLHPARKNLFRINLSDRLMAGMAILAAIPGVFFILDHIGIQRLNIADDQHAEFGHWSTMAVLVTLVVLWGLIGSTDLPGRTIATWMSGLAPAAWGLASVFFPNVASALGTGWAIAAIGWGFGYLALAARRARSSPSRPERAVAQAAERSREISLRK